ncbi:hypothetical protein BKA64DRAFT_754147, partial [Cadophora sp. MPI-SDFR-AT-0126]
PLLSFLSRFSSSYHYPSQLSPSLRQTLLSFIMQFSKLISILVFAAATNAAAIETPAKRTIAIPRSDSADGTITYDLYRRHDIAHDKPDNTTLDTRELSKRDGSYLLVEGSGGTVSVVDAPRGGPVVADVRCGRVTISDVDGRSGSCRSQLTGTFPGCDGCEYFGVFPRYSIRVSALCGNDGVFLNGGSDSGGAGEIGENISVFDCNNDQGGNTKDQNICAGPDWTLVRC